MAAPKHILSEFMVEQQNRIAESLERMGQNFATINAQLSGLTSSVYIQSVSQVVPVFEEGGS